MRPQEPDALGRLAERLNIVYAAMAWHWLDSALAYPAAHSVLSPAGHLAFWAAEHAFPEDFDAFFAEIKDVYDEVRESRDGEWPPARPKDVLGPHCDGAGQARLPLRADQ